MPPFTLCSFRQSIVFGSKKSTSSERDNIKLHCSSHSYCSRLGEEQRTRGCCVSIEELWSPERGMGDGHSSGSLGTREKPTPAQCGCHISKMRIRWGKGSLQGAKQPKRRIRKKQWVVWWPVLERGVSALAAADLGLPSPGTSPAHDLWPNPSDLNRDSASLNYSVLISELSFLEPGCWFAYLLVTR